MATVQLSNIIDTVVFQDLPAVNSPEKTALLESGIVTRNDLLDGVASASGKTAELPFWNDLDETSAPNLSSDNPASSATPDNVAQGEQICRKAFLNKGWSKSDLASEIAMGPKAMEHIRGRTDRYWDRQWQRRLISSLKGILSDNVTNDSGDMVHTAYSDVASPAVGNYFTRSNFTSALFTLGDAFGGVAAIAVHSVVYKRMVDNDDIDFIRDSQGNVIMAQYLGHQIIVDDSMPVIAGINSPKYISAMFGAGAFGYGEGMPDVPVEVEREASQGDGGGVETLWTRKTWILHPFGFKQTGTPAGVSLSLAELESAAAWDRVVHRKNIPIAFLETN